MDSFTSRDETDTVPDNVLPIKNVESNAVQQVEMTAREAMEMVQQIYASVKSRESRSETLARKAFYQLRLANERNKALEARVLQAEAQARAAEMWLLRLHAELENQISGVDVDVFVATATQSRAA